MRTRPGSNREVNSPPREPVPGVKLLFLVGFMGAGKTCVGQALSRQLGWQFEDLDDRIQAREAQTIAQIFRSAGEAAFRIAEQEAIQELLATVGSAPRVVALGGGAFAQNQNATLLEATGFPIVFLDAPVEELWRRCQGQALERPLRRDETQFRELYAARRPYYLRAGLRVETSGKPIETIAAEVASRLRLR
jgi:shikimate kinase